MDPTGTRWPATELVAHLNDGQREIVMSRPDALSTQLQHSCTEGARQTLPPEAMALIDVTNVGIGNFRALRKVDRKMLDATQPTWLSLAPSSNVVHFMYEPTEPRVFFLYQPPLAELLVDIVVSIYPTDVANPTGRAYSTVSGDISLPDVWANTLYSYIMFRAYNKDAEFGGNAQLAMTHYQQFKAGMGEQLKSSVAVAPKE
jgi:hypothetical protein